MSTTKQFYHCFGCGAHGNSLDFLMKFKNINFVEAIEELANIQGVSIPRDQADDQKYHEIKKIKEINEIAKIFFQRQLIKNNDKYDYLVNTRKIKKDVIEKYQLGFTGYQ